MSWRTCAPPNLRMLADSGLSRARYSRELIRHSATVDKAMVKEILGVKLDCTSRLSKSDDTVT